MTASTSEESQRRALARNRLFATALLVVAAGLFFATQFVWTGGFWLALLHAGAEAALIGGLADWFAVTALFRRPLGLPIPRTAIIPKNKDRIGEGLGDFVERNFLAPEILAERLRRFDPARRFAAWLSAPEHARLIANQIADALPFAIRASTDHEVRDFIARSFREQLGEIDLAPLLGQAIRLFTESGEYDRLLDRIVTVAQRLLFMNADRFYEIVAERSRWWIPKTIDRQIARRLVAGISDLLADARAPQGETRAAIKAALTRLGDSAHRARYLDELKHRLLDHAEVMGWLGSASERIGGVILDDLDSPASRTREALYTAMSSLGRTLAADQAMQERVNDAIEHVVLAMVPWHGQIRLLITEVVRGWDARTVSRRLELAMGSDLQYIRMSGTLVGASIGCLLFLVARFFAG